MGAGEVEADSSSVVVVAMSFSLVLAVAVSEVDGLLGCLESGSVGESVISGPIGFSRIVERVIGFLAEIVFGTGSLIC